MEESRCGGVTDKSWGLIKLDRFQTTEGQFFGSKVPFDDGIHLTISKGIYRRDNDLGVDNYLVDKEIISIRLTPLQFSDMLTKTNHGVGTPCTIEYTIDDGNIKYTPMDSEGVKLNKYIDYQSTKANESVKNTEKLIRELIKDKKISAKAGTDLLNTLRGADVNTEYMLKQIREDVDSMVIEAQASLRHFAQVEKNSQLLKGNNGNSLPTSNTQKS